MSDKIKVCLAQMERLFDLAIWDRYGKEWMPLYGYDGQVEAYAPAKEAITVLNYVWQEQLSDDDSDIIIEEMLNV